MATRAPFTAKIKLYPARPGGRIEYMRELQRLGYYIGEALRLNAAIWSAQPGGGPDPRVLVTLDTPGVNKVAVKPQFGTAQADAKLYVNANNPTQLPVRSTTTVLQNNNGVLTLSNPTNTVRVVPAQATIVGYYDPGAVSSSEVADAQLYTAPQPAATVFCCNEVVSGNRNYSWLQNPNIRVANEVKALRATLIQSIRENVPAAVQFEVYQIDYAGVVWGNRGYHFPT